MRDERSASYDAAKRVLDIFGALLGLVALSPVLLGTAALIALTLGRPVLFSQQRPGRDGRIFRLYKFRTMRPLDPSKGWTSNEERMTAFGRALRATSIDELPSLWNILRGQMSFIGPRPLRVSYLERYSDEQQRRHEVRPGLTGLAQVSGRNALGWDERIEKDLTYVETRSFSVDARILMDTFLAVVRPSGVAAEGQATMSEFFGPEVTRSLQLVELDWAHLPERVAWLSDERVRAGISITFDPNLPSTQAWFERAKEDPDRIDWVGVDRLDRSPVSMCGIQHTEDGAASLYLYVDPEQHGRGYGRDTMTLLITRARREGISRLDLETPASNQAASRLYEGLGFVETGTSEGGQKRRMSKLIASGHAD